MDSSHYIHSSARENMIEHLFVGEVLRRLWQREEHDVEVLRSEVDSSGYDLVMEHDDIVRPIQLKASRAGGRASAQNVNSKLWKKPSGCVVWIVFDSETLNLGPFFWFGNPPGRPLSDMEEFPVARHVKGDSKGVKAKRPNIRRVRRGKFRKIETLDELLHELFGLS